MGPPVNLQELMIERSDRGTVRRQRMLFSNIVLPAAVLGGFAAVIGWSLRDSFGTVTPVTVLPVIASHGEAVAAQAPLFQAAGWVEPRPQPVMVTALVEGIVDEVLVVEGQAVEAGQSVARLIRRDSEIAHHRAQALVRLREAEIESARAALDAAKALFAEPIPLIAAAAESDAVLAKLETELARLPAQRRAAEAKRDFSDRELAGKSQATDAVAAISIQRARSELETASALIEEYRQQAKSLERERQALAKRRDVLARQLEQKVDETRRVAEARARLQIATAQLEQAQADLDAAILSLERTEIRARSAGVVLALMARPGSRLMGIDRAAANDSSTVLTMYDPRHLQVRADVRLENVPQVLVGQEVRIETAVHPRPLTGRVLMATSMTDIQKNTLQVKLAIDDPPAALKPDMLVQATFLAPPNLGPAKGTSKLKLLVPRELIQTDGNDAVMWVADLAAGTARRRRVTTGATTSDGLIEVLTGVNIGDRLIVSGRESLADGQRVQVVRSDDTLGRDPIGPQEQATSATSSSSVRSRHSGPPDRKD